MKNKVPNYFVTDMDIDNASYHRVVKIYRICMEKLRIPSSIRENEQFVGYVNVVQQKAKRWNEKGEVDKFDVGLFADGGTLPWHY